MHLMVIIPRIFLLASTVNKVYDTESFVLIYIFELKLLSDPDSWTNLISIGIWKMHRLFDLHALKYI